MRASLILSPIKCIYTYTNIYCLVGGGGQGGPTEKYLGTLWVNDLPTKPTIALSYPRKQKEGGLKQWDS
jgi:hypothetical protein